jgi:antirestriction protein
MENKIYVGTYSKYNNGSIEGAWIDLENLSKEEFDLKCKELHKDETDPEFMFQDWECNHILDAYIDEMGIDSEFWEIKEQLENTSFDLEALEAYKSIFGEINFRDFEDKFFCHIDDYNVNRAFGDYMLEEMGELEQVPQHLRYYIDSELYGRDLLINDFTEFEGYIFRNC